MVPLIVERAREAADMLGLQTAVGPEDFDFIDDFRGPEYGVPSQAGVAAMQLAGRTEGLLLDPVYSGKALAGLLHRERHHKRHHGDPSDKPIVFVHTGGTPGIFANAALIAPWLKT
jgi:1-aminocyclopropane-1-carboxylate deaminase/D-cysteine desulfhydrase-like pyridoxal-dependent ACC family enzyme